MLPINFFLVHTHFAFFTKFDFKGPRAQESIGPVSDYWTNWPSVEVLPFVKDVRSVEISNLEPKKS